MNDITPFGTGNVDGWLELGVKRNMEGVEAEIERLEKDASARNELLEGAETAYEELTAAQDRDPQPMPKSDGTLARLANDDWSDDIINM